MRDQNGARSELKKRGQREFQRGRRQQHCLGDPGQDLHERRHRDARIDERAELADLFAATNPDRADLGDAAVLGDATGGFQVDDDERGIA